MSTTLHDKLAADPATRARVVEACVRLIDEEVSRKGMLAAPLKLGYKTVKGLRPGFVPGAMDFLLDDFCRALEPFFRQWADAPAREPLGAALSRSKDQVADALLGITDARAERSQHATVRALYFKLRGIAKGHVIEALPGLARTIEPFVRERDSEPSRA